MENYATDEYLTIYRYNEINYNNITINGNYFDDDINDFVAVKIVLFGRAYKMNMIFDDGRQKEIKKLYNYTRSKMVGNSTPEIGTYMTICFGDESILCAASDGDRILAYAKSVDKTISDKLRDMTSDVIQNKKQIIQNFILQTNKLFLLDPDYISVIEWILARIHGVPKNLLQTTPDLDEMPKDNRIHEESFGFCNNELTMLGKILSEDIQVLSNEQTALAYCCLIKVLPQVICNSWKDNIIFPNKHRQPRFASVDDAIRHYYCIDHINRAQIITIGSYVCYLMNDQNVFSSESSYYNNFTTFSQAYLQHEKDNELLAYKNRLLEDQEIKKSNLTIDGIDLMTGVEFEAFIADMFSRMNYRTQITKATGDQGIDVIAENDEMKIGIQAKCYSGNVGNAAIQEVVGGKKYYHVTHLLVVTNNYFTESAIRLAQANNVILWDRNILKEKLMIFNK